MAKLRKPRHAFHQYAAATAVEAHKQTVALESIDTRLDKDKTADGVAALGKAVAKLPTADESQKQTAALQAIGKRLAGLDGAGIVKSIDALGKAIEKLTNSRGPTYPPKPSAAKAKGPASRTGRAPRPSRKSGAAGKKVAPAANTGPAPASRNRPQRGRAALPAPAASKPSGP